MLYNNLKLHDWEILMKDSHIFVHRFRDIAKLWWKFSKHILENNTNLYPMTILISVADSGFFPRIPLRIRILVFLPTRIPIPDPDLCKTLYTITNIAWNEMELSKPRLVIFFVIIFKPNCRQKLLKTNPL